MAQTKSPDVDNLLDTLGSPGRLQILSFLCLCMNMCIVMTNHMSSVFYVAKTDYSCKINSNFSSPALPLVARPDEVRTDECFVLKGNNSEKTRCSEWKYSLPDGEKTIISEVIMRHSARLS